MAAALDAIRPIPLQEWKQSEQEPFSLPPNVRPPVRALDRPIELPVPPVSDDLAAKVAAFGVLGVRIRLIPDRLLWADRVGSFLVVVLQGDPYCRVKLVRHGVTIRTLETSPAELRHVGMTREERLADGLEVLRDAVMRPKPYTKKQRASDARFSLRLAIVTAEAAVATLGEQYAGRKGKKAEAWLRRQLEGLGKEGA